MGKNTYGLFIRQLLMSTMLVFAERVSILLICLRYRPSCYTSCSQVIPCGSVISTRGFYSTEQPAVKTTTKIGILAWGSIDKQSKSRRILVPASKIGEFKHQASSQCSKDYDPVIYPTCPAKTPTPHHSSSNQCESAPAQSPTSTTAPALFFSSSVP